MAGTTSGSGSRRRELPLPALAGSMQLGNAATALAVLEAAEPAILVPDDAVRAGLAQVRLPDGSRCFGADPEWILDVAHNPDAARALAASLFARRCNGSHDRSLRNPRRQGHRWHRRRRSRPGATMDRRQARRARGHCRAGTRGAHRQARRSAGHGDGERGHGIPAGRRERCREPRRSDPGIRFVSYRRARARLALGASNCEARNERHVDIRVRERLVGALVLVTIVVLLVPAVLKGRDSAREPAADTAETPGVEVVIEAAPRLPRRTKCWFRSRNRAAKPAVIAARRRCYRCRAGTAAAAIAVGDRRRADRRPPGPHVPPRASRRPGPCSWARFRGAEGRRTGGASCAARGYAAFVLEYRADGQVLYRVRVGPEQDRARAAGASPTDCARTASSRSSRRIRERRPADPVAIG